MTPTNERSTNPFIRFVLSNSGARSVSYVVRTKKGGAISAVQFESVSPCKIYGEDTGFIHYANTNKCSDKGELSLIIDVSFYGLPSSEKCHDVTHIFS